MGHSARNRSGAPPKTGVVNGQDREQTEILRAIWNEMKTLGRSLGTRIDQSNARIDRLGERLDARLNQTNARLDDAVARLDATVERLDITIGTLRDMAWQQVTLGRSVKSLARQYGADLAELRERVARLEAKVTDT